ncbi:putative zinc-binding metallopeptidase [soil metagenome]
MRTFACHHCGQLVFFENTECLHCHAELGFLASERELLTLKFDQDDGLVPYGDRDARAGTGPWSRCANHVIAGCNWLVDPDADLCTSCGLTRTRPGDSDTAGMKGFHEAETGKRRLLFELFALGLPVERYREGEGGLAFDLLSSSEKPVTTGHANGVITLDLAESDDARREQRRQQLGEPYRTVLGHMRHEVGHYYWTVLATSDEDLTKARALLGDEREDYQEAIARHYEEGPPEDWHVDYVSAYATMHPAEDWAETFAHYLHIRDTLQTAAANRVRVLGPEAVAEMPQGRELSSVPREGPQEFSDLIAAWLPLTYALNALNRSMGYDDLYPFVLTRAVIEKLGLVHELVLGAA